MRYMGSKAKIAKYIVPIIQEKIDESNVTTYIEPFVGGCNVIDKIWAERRIASDKNKYLIALFKYMQAGGELPDRVTREEYNEVRVNIEKYPEWYVGAIGFLASYNGRFFDGGYAGHVKEKKRFRDYYCESRDSLIDQMQRGRIDDIEFQTQDYREINPQGCVIYCDPPYIGTTEYDNSKEFNHIEFWKTTRKWTKQGNIVLISEENAPDDFISIWEKDVERSLAATARFKATEKLFVWRG